MADQNEKIEPADVRSAEAQKLLAAFVDDLRERYGDLPTDAGHFDITRLDQPRSVFLVVRLDGEAVGCGALVQLDEQTAEIKRMYVAAKARQRGLATKILQRLEEKAREFDYDVLRLETGTKQPESIAVYGKAGFYRIPPFGVYKQDRSALCFEKRI